MHRSSVSYHGTTVYNNTHILSPKMCVDKKYCYFFQLIQTIQSHFKVKEKRQGNSAIYILAKRATFLIF